MGMSFWPIVAAILAPALFGATKGKLGMGALFSGFTFLMAIMLGAWSFEISGIITWIAAIFFINLVAQNAHEDSKAEMEEQLDALRQNQGEAGNPGGKSGTDEKA